MTLEELNRHTRRLHDQLIAEKEYRDQQAQDAKQKAAARPRRR